MIVPESESNIVVEHELIIEPEIEPEPLIFTKGPTNSLWLYIMTFVTPWCERTPFEHEPHRQPYTNKEVISVTDPDYINCINLRSQNKIYLNEIIYCKNNINWCKYNIIVCKNERNLLLLMKTIPICPLLIVQLQRIMSNIHRTKVMMKYYKDTIRFHEQLIFLNIEKINFLNKLMFPLDWYDD